MDKIKGVAPYYTRKLSDIGIETIDKLLEEVSTLNGRKAIEEKKGIPCNLILEWVITEDHFRIQDIDEEYPDSLEKSRYRFYCRSYKK